MDIIGLPPVSRTCADFEIFLFNEERETLLCDEDYTAIVRRTYKAVDEFGNEDECSHTIYIERVDLDGIIFPESLSVLSGNAISCGDTLIDFDQFGVPLPWPNDPTTGSGSGVPIICDPDISNGLICPLTGSGTGVPLVPGSNQALCSAAIIYTDIELPEIGCVRKIMRTWEVREWWCNGESSIGGVQLIEVVDDIAPVFDCPDDITVSTNDNCAGSVNLPSVDAFDECGHDIIVAIETPNGIIHSNGGLAELEVGENTVTYVVSDECYNQNRCDVNVTVRDNTEPVAICERFTVVSISTNGNTVLSAEDVDDGSWDECGLDRIEVRRMDTLCVASDTLFGNYVNICCADVGTDLMVVFQAVDKGGNTNRCMVNVEVQDKISASLVCPPDVTIDCRVAYDLNNLGLTFGLPEVVDNCADLDDLLEFPTANVNQCGIGDITRRFELQDENGLTLQTCFQHIFIENTTPFVGANILWPLNYEITGGCSLDDLNPQNLPDNYNFPVFTSGDDECSLLGFDYEDKVFEAFPGSGECAHIERTWTVIN